MNGQLVRICDAFSHHLRYETTEIPPGPSGILFAFADLAAMVQSVMYAISCMPKTSVVAHTIPPKFVGSDIEQTTNELSVKELSLICDFTLKQANKQFSLHVSRAVFTTKKLSMPMYGGYIRDLVRLFVSDADVDHQPRNYRARRFCAARLISRIFWGTDEHPLLPVNSPFGSSLDSYSLRFLELLNCADDLDEDSRRADAALAGDAGSGVIEFKFNGIPKRAESARPFHYTEKPALVFL